MASENPRTAGQTVVELAAGAAPDAARAASLAADRAALDAKGAALIRRFLRGWFDVYAERGASDRSFKQKSWRVLDENLGKALGASKSLTAPSRANLFKNAILDPENVTNDEVRGVLRTLIESVKEADAGADPDNPKLSMKDILREIEGLTSNKGLLDLQKTAQSKRSNFDAEYQKLGDDLEAFPKARAKETGSPKAYFTEWRASREVPVLPDTSGKSVAAKSGVAAEPGVTAAPDAKAASSGKTAPGAPAAPAPMGVSEERLLLSRALVRHPDKKVRTAVQDLLGKLSRTKDAAALPVIEAFAADNGIDVDALKAALSEGGLPKAASFLKGEPLPRNPIEEEVPVIQGFGKKTETPTPATPTPATPTPATPTPAPVKEGPLPRNPIEEEVPVIQGFGKKTETPTPAPVKVTAVPKAEVAKKSLMGRAKEYLGKSSGLATGLAGGAGVLLGTYLASLMEGRQRQENVMELTPRRSADDILMELEAQDALARRQASNMPSPQFFDMLEAAMAPRLTSSETLV